MDVAHLKRKKCFAGVVVSVYITPGHRKLQVLCRTNNVLAGRLQVKSTAPVGQSLAGAWWGGMTPSFYRMRMRIECSNCSSPSSHNKPAVVQVITTNLAPCE